MEDRKSLPLLAIFSEKLRRLVLDHNIFSLGIGDNMYVAEVVVQHI